MENVLMVNLTDCVDGTTTSFEGIALFTVLDKAIQEGKIIKLSLANATLMSSSFLNSSFGEIFDKYGYEVIRKHIILTNYLPSQAIAIKKYLDSLKDMVN